MSLTITPPSGGIREIEWLPQSAVAVVESPFSLKQQVHKFSGQRRMVTVRLAPLSVAGAKEWIAFFLKLNGPEGTFYLSDTVGQNPTLTRGTPLVNGADQFGKSLVTDGWTTGTTVLSAGEWIELAGRLYQVTEDVTSDVSGNATLQIWPEIPVGQPPIDNAVIEADAPQGMFRLVEAPAVRWTVNRLVEGLSFTAVEVQPEGILDALGIDALIASSMTRDLYGAWTGSDRYEATGSDVTRLCDQSGNGYHWDSDGATDPTVAATGELVFAGSQETLESAATGANLGDDRMVFMVIDVDAVDTQMLLTRGSTANDVLGVYESGAGTDPQTGITVGDYLVDGTVVSPKTRGALYTALAGNKVVVCIEEVDFSEMAGNLRFGVEDGTWFFDGDLYEIVVTPALSDEVRDALIAEMMGEYGIS